MKIALASDHTGLEQVKEIISLLESLGHECRNYGPQNLNPDDDYPDFIFPAVQAVASGEYEKGIIIGGSGQGEAMAANRIKGVRCALFYGQAVPKSTVDITGKVSHDPYEIVRLSRQHNDANVLSLAARFVSLEEMKSVVKMWLETNYLNEDRHARRINKLDSA